MPTWQVGTYQLNINSHANSSSSGTFATLRLQEASGASVANVTFTSLTSPPSNSVSGSTYTLYFAEKLLAPVMEMLREEAPIYVNYTSATNVNIGTAAEAVGEDEGP